MQFMNEFGMLANKLNADAAEYVTYGATELKKLLRNCGRIVVGD